MQREKCKFFAGQKKKKKIRDIQELISSPIVGNLLILTIQIFRYRAPINNVCTSPRTKDVRVLQRIRDVS